MTTAPKALIIGTSQAIIPDSLICSGAGEPDNSNCPHSCNGRIPDPVPLSESDSNYSIDKGKPGDLCPPCAEHNLSHLGHWQGHQGQTFPVELLDLRLFRCRMGIWLVIPGLREDDPTNLTEQN